jgi:nucleotide-binding universal stress UspA family protein
MTQRCSRPHNATLLVMADYGHSYMREIIFGGFTRSVLQSADITALLIH